MRVAVRLQPGQEGAQAPDAAEVVDAYRALDDLGIDVEEAPARGDARVVHEQIDRRVTFQHARRHLVDLRAVGDVADLPLPADLRSDPLEVVGAPGQEHAVPALAGELACDCLADSSRRSRDHRDTRFRHCGGTLPG